MRKSIAGTVITCFMALVLSLAPLCAFAVNEIEVVIPGFLFQYSFRGDSSIAKKITVDTLGLTTRVRINTVNGGTVDTFDGSQLDLQLIESILLTSDKLSYKNKDLLYLTSPLVVDGLIGAVAKSKIDTRKRGLDPPRKNIFFGVRLDYLLGSFELAEKGGGQIFGPVYDFGQTLCFGSVYRGGHWLRGLILRVATELNISKKLMSSERGIPSHSLVVKGYIKPNLDIVLNYTATDYQADYSQKYFGAEASRPDMLYFSELASGRVFAFDDGGEEPGAFTFLGKVDSNESGNHVHKYRCSLNLVDEAVFSSLVKSCRVPKVIALDFDEQWRQMDWRLGWERLETTVEPNIYESLDFNLSRLQVSSSHAREDQYQTQVMPAMPMSSGHGYYKRILREDSAMKAMLKRYQLQGAVKHTLFHRGFFVMPDNPHPDHVRLFLSILGEAVEEKAADLTSLVSDGDEGPWFKKTQGLSAIAKAIEEDLKQPSNVFSKMDLIETYSWVSEHLKPTGKVSVCGWCKNKSDDFDISPFLQAVVDDDAYPVMAGEDSYGAFAQSKPSIKP